MHLGFSSMNNLDHGRPDVLGRQLEERGYDSFWVGEHAHMLVERRTPYPAGGELPETYKRMADPFVSLAFVAAATTKLRLGVGVALLLERELFTTAKEVATLDQLSGGRVLLGVGVGWNKEEFENVAKVPWSKRYSGLRDCVMALRTLWTQGEAEYHGEYYSFDKVWSWPKPLQQPWPPIYLGVAGRTGTGHAAEWADAWFPIDASEKDFGPRLERFRNMVRDAGRDPARVGVTVVDFGEPREDALRRYRDLGIQSVVISGPKDDTPDRSKTLRYMDRYAKLIPELAG